MTWDKIFNKFAFKRMYRIVFAWLDWRTSKSESVRKFLMNNIGIAQQLEADGKLPRFTGTRDEIVLEILQWVHSNIKYVKDSFVWKVPDKWQFINETLDLGSGDCEDGAVLIYCLAILNGINPLQIKLVTGSVIGGGHCFVEYAPDECLLYHKKDPFQWFTIDWCYWYDDKQYQDRIQKSDNYFNDWWSISII